LNGSLFWIDLEFLCRAFCACLQSCLRLASSVHRQEAFVILTQERECAGKLATRSSSGHRTSWPAFVINIGSVCFGRKSSTTRLNLVHPNHNNVGGKGDELRVTDCSELGKSTFLFRSVFLERH